MFCYSISNDPHMGDEELLPRKVARRSAHPSS